MTKILLVEDSNVICSFLSQKIQAILDVEVDIAHTFLEAKNLLDHHKEYMLALVDIHLPDTDDTAMVDYMIRRKIPTIVMTADYDERIHVNFRKRNIIDFVLKESPESLNYIVDLVFRVFQNKKTKTLVVDDSTTATDQLKNFLQSQLYDVYCARDPLEALKILERHGDIKIVITDYHMPYLSGLEFLKIIRRNFTKCQLSVIGISEDEKSAISFLKHGANDFVTKPLMKEAFVTRVNNSAEFLENILKLEALANIDHLTKVANRKYFLEYVERDLELSKKAQITGAIAMIDIDNFKKINDTYGHGVGDEVIKAVANLLKNAIGKEDLVARFGGEEFIIYFKNAKPKSTTQLLHALCQKASRNSILAADGRKVHFTISVGVAFKEHASLSERIFEADRLLYTAKQSGKNRVIDEMVFA